ncbi:UNVERIFIED_CONTAM: hypothetical protein Q9R58_18955 [Methylobacteriaceae bacterium AG10]|nr:hypothetical protein [Methylobacteriaceae bacterium AG10]
MRVIFTENIDFVEAFARASQNSILDARATGQDKRALHDKASRPIISEQAENGLIIAFYGRRFLTIYVCVKINVNNPEAAGPKIVTVLY